MLKISIHEDKQAVEFTLSGRLAGPWVEELSRTWSETAPRLGSRVVQFDLRDLTYSDPAGKQLLRGIYAQARVQLLAGSLWTQHLADEITNGNANGKRGVANGHA